MGFVVEHVPMLNTVALISALLPFAFVFRLASVPVQRSEKDRKSTRLNSSHRNTSRMPSSA